MDVDKIPLIGGHPVLDFLNSGENPGQPDEVNYLGSYEALVAWSLRVGLIAADAAFKLRRLAGRNKAGAQRAWARAMSLRGHLLAVIHAASIGRNIPRRDLEQLNRVISEAMASRILAGSPDRPRGESLGWRWKDTGDLDVMTKLLAIGAAELLADPVRQQGVRTCANGACGWVFLDVSGRRRWCRMNVCGSVHKVRRFRERQRKQAGRNPIVAG